MLLGVALQATASFRQERYLRQQSIDREIEGDRGRALVIRGDAGMPHRCVQVMLPGAQPYNALGGQC